MLDKDAKTWRVVSSPLPRTPTSAGVSAGLIILGPGRALITTGRGISPDRTWFTRDSGRTWHPGTDQLERSPVAEVPSGAPLVSPCTQLDSEGNYCVRSQLSVIMPDTGRYHRLAQAPDLTGQLVPAGETEDGTLFVSGTNPATNLPTLAVSKDRGRTWTTARLPGVAEGGWGLRVVADKDGCYAAQPGQHPDEEPKNGLLTIHHSPDCGTDWKRVWRYRSEVEPRSILGVPIAAADGSLTVHSESGIWRSTDNGRTFRHASGSDGSTSGWVSDTPIGYLWSPPSNNDNYYLSEDGVRRQTFRLGQS